MKIYKAQLYDSFFCNPQLGSIINILVPPRPVKISNVNLDNPPKIKTQTQKQTKNLDPSLIAKCC